MTAAPRQRPPFDLVTAQVSHTAPVSPRMRRITLTGTQVKGFGAAVGDAIKLVLAGPGQWRPPTALWGPEGLSYLGGTPALRAYSISRVDADAGELDITALTHGRGPGSRWAAAARPGDTVQFVGPRRDYLGTTGADLLLVAGDETAVWVAAGILAELPAGQRAHVVLEVADERDAQPLPDRDGATVTWLYRGDRPAGGGLLEAGVRAVPWPTGRVQAWVAAEAGEVRRIRAYLRGERGLDRASLTTFGYWREGLTSTQLDEAAAAGEEIDER
ncbi:MAG TPA: siderophore-interacting protein [Pilimelia sp.]|nr:siderophore-interacting protein [Pilimelia sp.]